MATPSTREVIRVSSQATLGIAFAAVHVVGYQRQLTVSLIHIANASANDRTVELCAYPPSGAPGATNALLWDFTVPKNDFIEFGEGMILNTGWTIAGLASVAAAINVLICGTEQ